MLSLASLLNPAPSGSPASCFPATPMSISPATSFVDEPFSDRNSLPKNKMSKESAGYTKSRAKGIVNFYPFENLDEESLREVRKFRVSPLGSIQDCCRHIPYNSGKKDFYEKTGRESFEVFQYTFKVPGDNSDYTVMWDYNVGLVRMTPFFKCCKYSKTTPAKMLNMNPGLRNITHSITGGSIMAQGYWMPFSCAKAVCATFCHHIAGALIPIFGPKFLSECVHPESPDHGRMIIDPEIVVEASREADMFRRVYAEQSTTPSGSPRPARRSLRFPNYDNSSQYDRRQRFRKGMIIDSPYTTDTDNDVLPGPDFSPATQFHQLSPIPAPRTSAMATRWTAANHNYNQYLHPPHRPAAHAQFHRDDQHPYPGAANPWLSAVPRLGSNPGNQHRRQQPAPSSHPVQGLHLPPPPPPPASPQSRLDWTTPQPQPQAPPPKRPVPSDYADYKEYNEYEYDAGESQVGSSSSPTTSRGGGGGEDEDCRQGRRQGIDPLLPLPPPPPPVSATGGSGVEKNAALLLMNLSMGEAERDGEGREGRGARSMLTPESVVDMHRSKRRRATSM